MKKNLKIFTAGVFAVALTLTGCSSSSDDAAPVEIACC